MIRQLHDKRGLRSSLRRVRRLLAAKRNKFYSVTASAFITLTVGAGMFSTSAVAESYLNNGTFDTETPLAGWQVQADGGRVEARRLSGWFQGVVKFNSERYDKALIVFNTGGLGSGRCWIDNIQAIGFSVKNPGFEQADGNHCAGWDQDEPGKHTHVSTIHASEGRTSMLLSDPPGESVSVRFSQIVDVKPKTEYSFTFDYHLDEDSYPGMECLVLDPQSEYYQPGTSVVLGELDKTLLLPNQIADQRAWSGRGQCVLFPDGGQVALAQDIAVPGDTNLEASVDLRTEGLEGQVVLTITDTKSGQDLAEKTEASVNSDWHRLRVRFVSRSGSIKVTLAGRGKGTAVVDNIEVSSPELIPPVKKIIREPAGRNMRLPATVTVTVKGHYGQMLDTGLDMLQADLRKLGNLELLPRPTWQRLWDPAFRETIAIRINEQDENKDKESYRLGVDSEGISIDAPHERGAFYGIMTLLQLFSRDDEGRPIALACSIEDWPDMPWRAVHMGAPGLTYESAARLKYNVVLNLDDYGYEIRKPLRYGLTPIVHDNPLHYKGKRWGVAIDNPANLHAGEWIEDEQIVLRGEHPVDLARRNVLRTKLVDIVVTSADGKTTYREHSDYQVIPGDLMMPTPGDPFPFKDDAKPFSVQRLPKGRIADGETVLVSYNHIPLRFGQSILCLAEPGPQEWSAKWAADMVREYGLKYVGANISEIPDITGKDIRDLKTGMTPAQLVARLLKRMDEAVKSVDPECRLVGWSDNYLAWQNGKLSDIGPLLPKDMILLNWNYDSIWIKQNGVRTARHWGDLEREFLFAGWFQLPAIRMWAQAASYARKQGWPCLGLVGTAWEGLSGGIEEVAICSWQVPQPGDKRYISLDLTEADR